MQHNSKKVFKILKRVWSDQKLAKTNLIKRSMPDNKIPFKLKYLYAQPSKIEYLTLLIKQTVNYRKSKDGEVSPYCEMNKCHTKA